MIFTWFRPYPFSILYNSNSNWVSKLVLKITFIHRTGKNGDSSLHRGPLGYQNGPKSTYKHLPTFATPELWGYIAFFILYFDSISNRVMSIFDFDFGMIIPNPLNFFKSTWISISIVIRKLLGQKTQNNLCSSQIIVLRRPLTREGLLGSWTFKHSKSNRNTWWIFLY